MPFGSTDRPNHGGPGSIAVVPQKAVLTALLAAGGDASGDSGFLR
jgi:hypothetical protein